MKDYLIPTSFLTVKYNGEAYPGSKVVIGFKNGANCQHFIYEIYRFNGLEIPEFRSSEMWEDTEYTVKVTKLQPLDILLFNPTENAWGAHFGMYLGNEKVIHLSKAIGYPVIWDLKKFAKLKKYKILIGAKRLKVLIK